jgi:hypothetical protein
VILARVGCLIFAGLAGVIGVALAAPLIGAGLGAGLQSAGQGLGIAFILIGAGFGLAVVILAVGVVVAEMEGRRLDAILAAIELEDRRRARQLYQGCEVITVAPRRVLGAHYD